jgi:putative membrane protein
VRSAFAHDGGGAPAGPAVWDAWTLDPAVLVPLAVAAFLYGRGSRRLGAREACFAGGTVALFLALVWPLDVLGEHLVWAHMAQHAVLMNLAAPLLALANPAAAMLRALPRAWRRGAAMLLWQPGLLAATALHLALLWAWHVPSAIAAALESEALHIAMHATLLVAALLFWTAVLRPAGGRHWAPIAALLVTLKLTGAVCIVLLLQPGPLYGAYGEGAAAWGLAPAEDEHLGWGIMMSAGALAYLAAAVALFGTSLARLERLHPAAPPSR